MICKLNKKYVNKHIKKKVTRRCDAKYITVLANWLYISTKIYARPQLNVEYSRFAAFKNKTLFILGWNTRFEQDVYRFSFVFNCCCFLETANPLQLTFSYGRARIFIDTINLRDPLYCSLTDFLLRLQIYDFAYEIHTYQT